MFAVIFICGRIAGKIAKIAKIGTRKNFLSRGSSSVAYTREYSPGKFQLVLTS